MKKILALIFCLLASGAAATSIITRDGMSAYSFGFMSRNATGVLITQNDYTAGSLATGDSDTRSSTATYFNSSNVLSSAAANVARFDYSTGVAQGWLVESTSTNVMQESNGFASAPWLGNNLNYTQNVTGIDGATSGWTMIPAVASSSQVYEYETIAANSSQNTISLYAKAGTWSYIYLNLENAGGTVWASAVFNVGAAGAVATQTSTAGGATIAATSQTLMANGYYRITMTSTVASAVYPLFGYAPAATGNTFALGGGINASTWAATETLLITDFQYENTSFPTSYIPTPTTSSVTRAADTAANAAWYNGTSGNYLMVESKSESTGVISRASYCNSGCTGTSFSAPTNVWIRRICQFTATTAGATAAIANAAYANGTVCTSAPPYAGPGDIVSGATAWYGLRAYNAAHAAATSKAVSLRRASDNTICDFNVATSGALGVSASGCSAGAGLSLASFATTDATCTGTAASSTTLIVTGCSSTPHVGSTITGTGFTQPVYATAVSVSSGSGTITMNTAQTVATASTTMTYGLYIPTWYDQSGGGYNITQSTSSAQPQLLPLCGNLLPCVSFVGLNNQFLAGTYTGSGVAQPYTLAAVANRLSVSGYNVMLDISNVVIGFYNTANLAYVSAQTGVNLSLSATDGVSHSFIGIVNGSNGFMTVDANSTAASNTGTNTLTTSSSIQVGYHSAYLTGYIMETGIWPSQFNSMQYGNMCHNQYTYWGTSVSC
jgi:hypothetical protein